MQIASMKVICLVLTIIKINEEWSIYFRDSNKKQI